MTRTTGVVRHPVSSTVGTSAVLLMEPSPMSFTSLKSSSRAHRIAATCVVALLAANAAVLVAGLADAVDAVVQDAKPRTIALITSKDGTQIAVDPTTPAGWKAISDAHQRGDDVADVTVPDPAVAASHRSGAKSPVTIPGVNAIDLQKLLAGTVDQITTTVHTIVDSAGKTVVSIVTEAGSTVSSIVDEGQTTVSSVVQDDVIPVVTSIV